MVITTYNIVFYLVDFHGVTKVVTIYSNHYDGEIEWDILGNVGFIHQSMNNSHDCGWLYK